MNQIWTGRARDVFLKAAAPGPAKIPELFRKILLDLPSTDIQAVPLDTIDIESHLNEDFLTRALLFSDPPLSGGREDDCICALRWILEELRSWKPENPHCLTLLQMLLTGLTAFDAANTGVDAVLPTFNTPHLTIGFRQLLSDANFRTRMNEAATSLWDDAKAASRDGDYEKLKIATRHLDIDLRPDTRLAIYLLSKASPASLSELITQSDSVVFSFAAYRSLGQSAPAFALWVDDITFKFLCALPLADLQPEQAPSDAVNIFSELLRQVSSSKHFRSWLRAYFRYPNGDRVSDLAIGQSLGTMTTKHWDDFLSAVELWTHPPTAVAVTKILLSFFRAGDSPQSSDMWRLAHQRWERWDYGRDEVRSHMFAPAMSSFDFPVAMHFANLPSDEVEHEVIRLTDAIASVEQRWFTSVTDLLTYRNRLASRLRLVNHGRALAAGSADALPPPPVPDGEYEAVRYRYFDAYSLNKRFGR